MKPCRLNVLALLPLLLPLPAAAQAQRVPRARPAQQRQLTQENLGRFLRQLTDARPEQAAAMLDAMPDINAATPGERITALHAAIAYDRPDILAMLLQRGAHTEALMKPGLTPLSAAAIKNDTDSISLLLRYGAQLNHHTQGGVSALKLACAKGNIDAAQVLLAHGADPIPADAEGHTALTLAQEHAGENRLPLMLMLLEHGASPDARAGDHGESPLMVAISTHDLPVADLLLTHGANADTVETAGSSPLMLAASYGYTRLVERLLAHGANLTRQDADGNDALDHAALGARMAHCICAAFNGDDLTLHNPEQVDSPATCRLLLRKGASVNHVDARGSTPLIIAARAGEPENVRLLLDHGADINARDHEGHTALISALLPAEDKVRLTFRLRSEASRRRALHYLTPLFRHLPRTQETVRLLLRAGADPTLRDASGRCALDYATTPALQELLRSTAR